MEIYAFEVLDLQILIDQGRMVYQKFIYTDKKMMNEDKKAYEALFLKGVWTYEENGRIEVVLYTVEERTDGERGYKVISDHYGHSEFNLEKFDVLRTVYVEVREKPFWKRELISAAVSEGKLDHLKLEDLA